MLGFGTTENTEGEEPVNVVGGASKKIKPENSTRGKRRKDSSRDTSRRKRSKKEKPANK